MLPGRLHESRGDAAPREMVAAGWRESAGTESGLQAGSSSFFRPEAQIGRRRQPPAAIGRDDPAAGVTTRRVFAGLVGALFALSSCSSKPNFRFVPIHGPMPGISGSTLQGGTLGPTDYRGKVVLVNFWASWCAPCRREQPGLEALWRKLEPSGKVAFIGVDYKDSASAAGRYLKEFGVTYPSVSDPRGTLEGAFNVPYLPATILVDADGQLHYRLVGAQNADFVEGLLQTMATFGGEPSNL
jgi:thiol-disulfide isomerase/thioredoxin